MKETIFEGKYIRLVKDGTWEYVERVGSQSAAIIIPVLIDSGFKKLVLIKEWRVPLQKFNLGLPAGLVGDKGEETPETAAIRELEEETGFRAGRVRHLCSGPPSSGLSNEMLHFYLADKLEKVSDKYGTDGEQITVYTLAIDEIEKWFLKDMEKQGCVIDPKIYMALWFATNNECI